MAPSLRRIARTYTIRQLCDEFGCTPRALRFYEDKGLLAPARRGPARIYSYRDRARLNLILRGKRVGLALAEIREFLDLYDADQTGAQQAARSIGKFRQQIVTLEQQRADIEAAIADLKSGIEILEARLAAAVDQPLPKAADYDQILRRQLGDA